MASAKPVRNRLDPLMEEMIDVYDHDRNRTGLTIPREGAFLKEG